MKAEMGVRLARYVMLVVLLHCGAVLAVFAAPPLPVPLRAGSEIGFPPYADVDTHGEATGFAVELLAAAARAVDIPLRFDPGEWHTVWNKLLQGDILVLPLVARLPEREGLVEFTRPHTLGYDSFFVAKGRAPINSIEQARALQIIVMRSDAAHDALVSRGLSQNLIVVDSLADGFRLLASGQHDALLAPMIQGNMQVRLLGLSAAIAHGPILQEYRREFCFAVNKGNTELRDRLDQGLAIVKANGEYDRLYRKWLGIYESATFPLRYVYGSIGTILVLILLLATWTWTLRRQVAARTAELNRQRDSLERVVAERTAQLVAARNSAEAATQAKSAFLANMSHEIRTPLNVIIGLGHLLRRDTVQPDQKQKLDQLGASSDHLLALINDILDFSKIEAEQLTLDGCEFRLGEVIEQTLRMVADQAQEKGLSLSADVAPSLLDQRLLGDPLRLAQVLINLLGNAVKFTAQGTVRLSVNCLTTDADRATLQFAVDDTGCGIAPNDQALLFQPFVQGDASTTRTHGGTGLGLVISQRLVTMMGGTIEVDSQVGTGSSFRFELSLPYAAPAAETRPVRLATHFQGTHVLFAEDHPQTQEILLEMLEDLGCDVDVAVDGADAVESARARGYDIILMDMQMPKLDGLMATRAIRTLPGYAGTPIIALTANAFVEDRQRCLDAGMNGHLAKPVTPATLAAVLGQWLPAQQVTVDEVPLCDNELSRALMQIPGLAVASPWRRTAEDVVDYCAQLARFLASHAPDMARLGEHLTAGDHAAARVIAHDLKGIAGLIGAQRIAALASDIETALRRAEASAVRALASECEGELARLADALHALQKPAL